MTHTDIIEKAFSEIENKHFAVTEQYLEIHELVFEGNKPKYDRIDTESGDGTAIVYFPIKGEKFFLAIYLDTFPNLEVRAVGTEPYNSVCFVASSESLDLKELSELTTLKHSSGKNKGDKRGQSGVWSYSSISFEPNPEPDEFEDKLKKLLNYLEQDKEGITNLIEQGKGYIKVAIEFHNGNKMLGGPHLDLESIKRLGELNLEIDFDLYVGGNSFKAD
jgi:hypothetical protein